MGSVAGGKPPRDAGGVNEGPTRFNVASATAPEHVPTMQANARFAVRQGRRDEKTLAMLKSIALSGQTPAWHDWAHRTRANGPGH